MPYDSCSVQVIQGDRLVIVGARGLEDLGGLIGDGFDLNDKTNLNVQVVRSKRPTGLRRRLAQSALREAGARRRPHSWLDLRADDHR